MRFCVIRHPDVAVPGTCPEDALELNLLRGWFRVSDWADSPDAFHLADFADAEPIEEPAEEAPADAEQPPSEDTTTAEAADAAQDAPARKTRARTSPKENSE